jgi:enoyl-CoA hydratase/carnithine racemase
VAIVNSALRTRRERTTLIVELNRPDRLNAFDSRMRAALAALWVEVATERDLRAVVLTGVGKGFCSGADVEDLAGPRRPRGADVDDELDFLPGPHLDVPVIVAVNGVCAGGGLHFVGDADIVIAAESATFVDPHVSVGQVSALEPISLALRVPMPALYRMALLGRGERWTARDALSLGLVSEVVPRDELMVRAMEIARTIAQNSPAAVAATRRGLRSLERRLLHGTMEEGWAAIQRHWTHPDSSEGPKAFAERRDPRWTKVR